MDMVKVIIENWPKTSPFLEYVPIVIAVIALVVSLYSVYLTRRSFITSHRPYVWAINYGVIDNNTIKPIPYRVAYLVCNAPARIIRKEVKIDFEEEQLLAHSDQNIVQFPDDRSESNFSIGKDEFERIMSRSNEDKAKLTRTISIEYSSLDGGKVYHYELKQSFNTADNQWKDISETAD